MKKRCTVPAAYQQNMWQRNKLQSLQDFLLSVCLLPLCGIALFISLFQGTVTQHFDNCTLKWLCCVNLYNLLLAVTPSETYYITDMSMQLKMREIRNEGVFLCNCKMIKFDLKISISSINPSLFHIKQMSIINIPIFWELWTLLTFSMSCIAKDCQSINQNMLNLITACPHVTYTWNVPSWNFRQWSYLAPIAFIITLMKSSLDCCFTVTLFVVLLFCP